MANLIVVIGKRLAELESSFQVLIPICWEKVAKDSRVQGFFKRVRGFEDSRVQVEDVRIRFF